MAETLKPHQPQYVVKDATVHDLDEVSSVFPLSFHPTSAYMRQAIPDTPIIRRWWTETNIKALSDPQIRLYEAVDIHTDRIAAICRCRITDESVISAEVDAGLWSQVPLTPDHDHYLCTSFIRFMAEERTAAMRDRRHIMIELLGTIHAYKGQGAGSTLVEAVCQVADSEQIPVFVEANGGVVGFYLKLGFAEVRRAVMPGGEYVEHVMIREPRKNAVDLGMSIAR